MTKKEAEFMRNLYDQSSHQYGINQESLNDLQSPDDIIEIADQDNLKLIEDENACNSHIENDDTDNESTYLLNHTKHILSSKNVISSSTKNQVMNQSNHQQSSCLVVTQSKKSHKQPATAQMVMEEKSAPPATNRKWYPTTGITVRSREP